MLTPRHTLTHTQTHITLTIQTPHLKTKNIDLAITSPHPLKQQQQIRVNAKPYFLVVHLPEWAQVVGEEFIEEREEERIKKSLLIQEIEPEIIQPAVQVERIKELDADQSNGETGAGIHKEKKPAWDIKFNPKTDVLTITLQRVKGSRQESRLFVEDEELCGSIEPSHVCTDDTPNTLDMLTRMHVTDIEDRTGKPKVLIEDVSESMIDQSLVEGLSVEESRILPSESDTPVIAQMQPPIQAISERNTIGFNHGFPNDDELRHIMELRMLNQSFDLQRYLADTLMDEALEELEQICDEAPNYCSEQLSPDEQDIISQIPKRPVLLDKENQVWTYHGLVDIIYALSYALRIGQGDLNAESAFTILQLSPLLSTFKIYSVLAELHTEQHRRTLTYGYMRCSQLFRHVFAHDVQYLLASRLRILQALLMVYRVLRASTFYPLCRLYIEPYINWIGRESLSAAQLDKLRVLPLGEDIMGLAAVEKWVLDGSEGPVPDGWRLNDSGDPECDTKREDAVRPSGVKIDLQAEKDQNIRLLRKLLDDSSDSEGSNSNDHENTLIQDVT